MKKYVTWKKSDIILRSLRSHVLTGWVIDRTEFGRIVHRRHFIDWYHDFIYLISSSGNDIQQEFYWPGIHEFVTRYVASCYLCQRNVSKGTVSKAPLGKLPLVETLFSVICVDIVGPISPPSIYPHDNWYVHQISRGCTTQRYRYQYSGWGTVKYVQ